MPVKNYNYRLAPDVKEPFDARRDSLGLTDSAAVRIAMIEWANGDDSLALRESAEAVKALRDENAALRAELAQALRRLGRVRDVKAPPGSPYASDIAKRRAFATACRSASWAAPLTPAAAAALSGYAKTYAGHLLAAMAGLGYLDRPRPAEYVPVPGMDMDKGVAEARHAVSAASMARSRAAGGGGQSPSPVPHVTPAEAGGAAGGSSAATGNGRIARAREKAEAVGAPLVAAKDVRRRRTAPVFKAGPDVDCLHENMRIRKGVCPDCKQWVTK